MIFLRGEQISGEYATGSLLDADGGSARAIAAISTRRLPLHRGPRRRHDHSWRREHRPGRDRGGVARASAVAEACVVGCPDDEWGQRIVAAVVLRAEVSVDADELAAAFGPSSVARRHPSSIVFRTELPHTETGKLLRRVVLHDLTTPNWTVFSRRARERRRSGRWTHDPDRSAESTSTGNTGST